MHPTRNKNIVKNGMNFAHDLRFCDKKYLSYYNSIEYLHILSYCISFQSVTKIVQNTNNNIKQLFTNKMRMGM